MISNHQHIQKGGGRVNESCCYRLPYKYWYWPPLGLIASAVCTALCEICSCLKKVFRTHPDRILWISSSKIIMGACGFPPFYITVILTLAPSLSVLTCQFQQLFFSLQPLWSSVPSTATLTFGSPRLSLPHSCSASWTLSLIVNLAESNNETSIFILFVLILYQQYFR